MLAEYRVVETALLSFTWHLIGYTMLVHLSIVPVVGTEIWNRI